MSVVMGYFVSCFKKKNIYLYIYINIFYFLKRSQENKIFDTDRHMKYHTRTSNQSES